MMDERTKAIDSAVRNFVSAWQTATAAYDAGVAAERKAFADELSAEMALDGFGCACEPRKQCGTCSARDVLTKALSPMLRRLRA